MMIPKDAKICPHCRKKLGWTWPAKIFMALIVIGIFGSFMGKDKETKNQPNVRPAATVQKQQMIQPSLRLIDFNWETSEHGSKYIVGSIRNDTDKKYTYAQVSFNVYDTADAQVGSAMANINNLEPNVTWKFKAIVIEKSAVKAKLAQITAF